MICGPGSLTVAHTANESVAVDELVAGARATRGCSRRSCAAEPGLSSRSRRDVSWTRWTTHRTPPAASRSPRRRRAKPRSSPSARAGPKPHLRVRVTAGGCSGFSYQLSFEDEVEADDHVIEGADGFRVLVDPAQRADRRGLHARVRRRDAGRRPEDGEPAGDPRVRLRRLVQRLKPADASRVR